MEQVFISHSSADRPFVESELLPALHRRGFETWYSKHDIPGASQWESEIKGALKASRWFIVVVSPPALCSDWVQAEVHWALENMKGRVIPLLVENCDLTDLHLKLIRLQHVDYRGNRTLARIQLLAVLEEEDIGEPDPTEQTMLSMQSTVRMALPKTSLRLSATAGPLKGQTVSVDIIDTALIGRMRGSVDIRLPDDEVSRIHAHISASRGADGVDLWVEDRQSANGTFVNGRRLTERSRLVVGDEIGIGRSLLVVESISA